MNGHRRGHRNGSAQRHSHPQNTIASQMFGPFGGIGFNMDDLFGAASQGSMGGFTSFSSFNSSFSGASGGGPSVKRTSTVTKFVQGKKITTKKYVFTFDPNMMEQNS